MNERIQELYKQCYETGPIGRDGWPEYSRLNEQKFAELIVKECANICDDLQGIPATEPRHCAEDIRIHFGLK
jgi:hypothetical protein